MDCNLSSTLEQWQRNGALLEAARSGSVTDATAALASGAERECTDRGPKALFGLLWAGASSGVCDRAPNRVGAVSPALLLTPDLGWTPVIYAAAGGHTAVLALLLEGGCKAAHAAANGTSGLKASAANGHTECVALLLLRGVDVNVRDSYGATPLHCALSWMAFSEPC